MKIFTVGSKSFVTSFQLAGIPGIISETPDSALTEITKLTDDSDVGLVLVSDDITESINDELTALRAQKSTLVFALPATGSEKTEVDYRVMLKKILGVSSNLLILNFLKLYYENRISERTINYFR